MVLIQLPTSHGYRPNSITKVRPLVVGACRPADNGIDYDILKKTDPLRTAENNTQVYDDEHKLQRYQSH